MNSPAQQLYVPLSNKEQQIIEALSKQSRIDCGELIRVLLFESGIISETAEITGKNPV